MTQVQRTLSWPLSGCRKGDLIRIKGSAIDGAYKISEMTHDETHLVPATKEEIESLRR